MTADLGRYDDWLGWLRERAAEDPDVLVVWVGGSAATGGFDEHSDLDLDVLCAPGTAGSVHERWLTAARADFDLVDVWELPLSTWPDGRQAFLHLEPDPGALATPTRIIDLHVSDLSEAHRHVDVRRHGTPIVLHDPDGLVVLRHDDQGALAAAMAEAVDQVRQRQTTAEWLVARALRRGHVAEATSLYLRFGLTPLVQLLRIEHCPWRYDFGLRYLREDLPGDVAGQVEALVPGPDLEVRSRACFTWIRELLDERPPVAAQPGAEVSSSSSEPSGAAPSARIP